MVTYKGAYARGSSQNCCCHCLHFCGEPLLTHDSLGDPPTLTNKSGSVSYGVTAPFSWFLVLTKYCLCPLEVECLFPPVSSDSLGIPSPFAGSQGCCGAQTFIIVGELLWYYCSVVCGLPTQWVWDLTLTCTPHTISLKLFICLWTWSIFLWYVPASSC